VTAGDDQELIAELLRLAPEACGVYLGHTDATRGRNAQVALAGMTPVTTDVQTTAIAVTAALLTTLDRSGSAPGSSRVVIVGADRNPPVAALAVAAGIGEVGSFGLDEVQNIRLRTLTYGATAVIDFRGGTVPRVAAGPSHQSPPVIAVDDATPLLELPGLLAAAQASTSPVGPATCLAATLALVELTPADQLLPRLSDPGLAKILVHPEPPATHHPRPVR
jgi:malate dehydrogenase (oxaloacetate-decarboxylating)